MDVIQRFVKLLAHMVISKEVNLSYPPNMVVVVLVELRRYFHR